MTGRRSAASRTERAIGPAWSSDHARGIAPRRLVRPYVGFRPTTPQSDAGIRIDPPVSLPIAPKHIPATSAAPLPPLDPPGIRSVAHGFLVGPKCGLAFVTPKAHSCRLVLPTL